MRVTAGSDHLKWHLLPSVNNQVGLLCSIVHTAPPCPHWPQWQPTRNLAKLAAKKASLRRQKKESQERRERHKTQEKRKQIYNIPTPSCLEYVRTPISSRTGVEYINRIPLSSTNRPTLHETRACQSQLKKMRPRGCIRSHHMPSCLPERWQADKR